ENSSDLEMRLNFRLFLVSTGVSASWNKIPQVITFVQITQAKDREVPSVAEKGCLTVEHYPSLE
ncbi:MAG: hypothetical protein ACXACI_18390, partial [Candidatus Hodarchaeales archaeon]